MKEAGTLRSTLGWVLGAGLGLLIGGTPAEARAGGAASETTERVGPAPGEVVPPFEAEAIDGVRRRIDYPKGSTTVLLFFLSGCPTCHRMLPLWNDAYERRAKGLDVIGVLMDREPPGFFEMTEVRFPVVRSPSRSLLQTYKVQRAPLTMRVGEGGKVLDVGSGQLDGIRLGEIFRR